MQRRYWTKKEDCILKAIVGCASDLNWVCIAKELNQRLSGIPRNPKQCRERWLNKLKCGETQLVQWSSLQDQKLQKQFLLICKKKINKWIHLANYLNSEDLNEREKKQRMPNEVKNRFYSIFRKGIRRINYELGKPFKSEDIRLLKPICISKLFELLEQKTCEQFLNFIYSKASRQESKNQSTKKFEEILKIIMTMNENTPSQQIEESLNNLVKKRKWSVLTNEQEHFSTFEQDKILSQISKRPIGAEKDYVDMFIGNFTQESQSLKFQQIDFGL